MRVRASCVAPKLAISSLLPRNLSRAHSHVCQHVHAHVHVVALLPAHVLFGLDVAPSLLAEYTVKNLQFALHVEPKNAAAERKILWAQDVQAKGEPTVPSTIGDELEHNPFMRVREPTVREHVGGGTDDVDVMRKLRNFKDTFAGSSRPWIPGGGPLPGL